MRKRFVHLEDGELHCNEDVPWGADALLTFVFYDDHPEGRYGFIASNGKYLNSNGTLQNQVSADCQFMLGFHDNLISLQDKDGAFLSCIGPKGVLKSCKDKKERPGKDELFNVTDSEPQFVILPTLLAGKFMSIRTSAEVKTDQKDESDAERFQLELDVNGQVSLRTSKTTFWGINADGTLIASATTKGPNEKFTVVWRNNRVFIQANNGKFLSVKSNGGVKADGAGAPNTDCEFTLKIINRPQLVLRGQFGFVGFKGASGRVEVNKSRADIFDLECEDGVYYFKGANGKFWGVDGDGVHCNSSSKVKFFLEFTERSKFLIKTEAGLYLEGEQNGGFKATGKGAQINTLWEY